MITDKKKQLLAKRNVAGLEAAYIKACMENNVQLVKYILLSSDLKENPKPECRNYQALREASNQGSFEVIEYLLNCPEINKKEEFIKARKQVLIRNACHSGNLKLVKYLLETPTIKEHVQISIDKYKAFEESIYSFNKDLVFYLYDQYQSQMTEKYEYLTQFFRKAYKDKFMDFAKELKTHAEIEKYFVLAEKSTLLTELINQNKIEDIDFLFNEPKFKATIKTALEYGSVMVALSRTSLEVLNLIIVNHNIPLTDNLTQFFENPQYNTENISKLFSNREIYKKISTKLMPLPKEKRIKI